MIADWLARPDRRGGGIMVRRGGCGMVGGIIWTDVKAVGSMQSGGRLTRSG